MREPLQVPSRPTWLALLLLAPTGCDPSLSDFELQITPAVLKDQDPFATSPELKLLLGHTDGTSEILYLGPAEGGEAEFAGVPPLDAGTVVGLILEEPGGETDWYNPQRLLAYGQALLGEDLAKGGAQSELGILVPNHAALGDMQTLGDAQLAHAAALAMAPGGSVFLFGGDTEPFRSEDGTLDRILVLRDTDTRPWSFEPLEATLPEPLLGLDAAAVEVDGEPRILLTGGRPDFNRSGPNTDTTLLFDPVAGEIVWGTGKKHAKLPLGRSGHDSVALADGSVFLYGGHSGVAGLGGDGSWAIFDPGALDYPYSGVTTTGEFGAAAASLGASGVLMCGGAVPDATVGNGDTHYVAVADCALISLQGAELPVPPLPEAVAHLAMTPLADGTILATGGIQGSIQARNNIYDLAPAVAKAWRFDGTAWTEVGSMTFPRAEHALIPLPDGRALVVGGVEHTGYFYAKSGPAVTCTEIYDPAARAFSTVGSTCVEAGSGARPRWATAPGEDAFVLEGWTGEQPDGSSDAFGMVGLGPELQRFDR